MADPRINTGLVLSGAAHAAVILIAAVSFATRSFDKPADDAVFVETLSISEFSKMAAGSRNAPQRETPKPLVEKKAEAPRPTESQKAPVEDKKPEIVTASSAAAPPPAPEPPKPPQREAAPVPTPPAAPRAPEKPPEAEALKRDKPEPKPEPKKETREPAPAAATAPMPPRRPPPQPQKRVAEREVRQEPSRFDADQIAALLDRRAPRRVAATGDTLSNTASLGASTGEAPVLSQNEIDALRARIQQCWRPVGGSLREEQPIIPITLRFRPDGSLAASPQVDMALNTQRERAMAESVIRAVVGCQPYTMLPRAKYEEWKELMFSFDPTSL